MSDFTCRGSWVRRKVNGEACGPILVVMGFYGWTSGRWTKMPDDSAWVTGIQYSKTSLPQQYIALGPSEDSVVIGTLGHVMLSDGTIAYADEIAR